MEQVLLISLILSLGSHHYPERENASQALRGLLPEPYLIWGSHHKDAEIAARSQALLDLHWWKVSGELVPADWPYQPWIDSLPVDYPCRMEIIESYLAQYPEPQGDAPIWQRYRLATRGFVFHLLKSGKSKEEVSALLGQMVEYEKAWILRHREVWQFSPKLLEAAGK